MMCASCNREVACSLESLSHFPFIHKRCSGPVQGWEVRQHEGRLLYIDHINKTTQWAPPSPQQRPGSAGTGAAGGGGGSRPGSGAPLSARMMQSASDMLARLQQRSTSSTSPSRATPLERLERRSSPPRVASPEGHYWSRTGSSNSLNSVPHAASAPDVTLGGSRPSTASEAPPSPALALAVGPQQPEQASAELWSRTPQPQGAGGQAGGRGMQRIRFCLPPPAIFRQP